jgi:protein-disulfide isomerase
MAALALASGPGSRPACAESPPVPREALEQAIREYLLNHPDVILESLRRGEQRQREAARAQARAAVQAHRTELLQSPDSAVGGNPAGDVTIMEFLDYRCPHCRRMVSVIRAILAEDEGVRLVYKKMPILGEESVLAASVRADMDAPEIGALLARKLALAQALGIESMPAFVIGGGLVVGAVDIWTLRERVNRARRGP